MAVMLADQILRYDPPDLLQRAEDASRRYQRAIPFPHLVVDLFDHEALRNVANELTAEGGTFHSTVFERKRVVNEWSELGPWARALATTLNGPPMLAYLRTLTGIDGLLPDPMLERAGYFDLPPGGYLKRHEDHARSTHQMVRRVNVLVYLNEGWQAGWGGALQLYASPGAIAPTRTIIPELGTVAIFDTPGAVHGNPDPIATPDGRHRLAFSAYYYSSPSVYAGSHRRVPVFSNDKALRRVALRVTPPIVMDAIHARRSRRAIARGDLR